ncbi:MAG: DUF3084 domain-containing protein [Synergistes sp.]|nr:DUF3084 domain-containing protein [Synergistes sp.]
MFEIFHDINWVLIGTLIAVSALVSWAGDVIGMKLGKKRITFMKLRPRYTSRIISILTGVGIALATILTLSVASEQVRTALFSMQVIQRQLTSTREELKKNEDTISRMEVDLFQSRGDLAGKEEELREVEVRLEEGAKKLGETQTKLSEMTAMRDKMYSEQQSLRKEKDKLLSEQDGLRKEKEKLLSESKKLETSIAALKKEADSLKSGIQRLREGRIAAFSDEVLAQTVITGSPITEAQVAERTEALRSEARTLLAYRFGIKDIEKVKLPNVTPDSANAARSRLAGANGRWMMRLTAVGNAVEGEEVNTKIETYPSVLIYEKGKVLYTHKFEPGTARDEIEETVSQALRTLNQRAAGDGVLRDPLTGNIGSVDSGDLIDAIDKIEQAKNSIVLEIVTERDIYSEGPLRVKCDLKKQ